MHCLPAAFAMHTLSPSPCVAQQAEGTDADAAQLLLDEWATVVEQAGQ